MNVAAVRTRYEHIHHSWRRASAERRLALIGELELLALQLPAGTHDGRGGAEVAALRADLLALVTEITIGQSDAG